MEASSVTGPAKNLIEFARRAKPAIDITIVTYNRERGDSAFAAAAKAAGIATHTIFERRRFDTGVLPELRKLTDADIVQTHNVKSHFFARWLGLDKRMPWIAFHHGYTNTGALDRMYSQLDYWSLRAAYRAVVVCGPFARVIERRGVRRERVHIQHNSVKPFTTPRADDGSILTVGRLSAEKGHADLFEAVASLKDARLVVVGDGPERAKLERQASRLGRVVMTGHRADVAPFYAAATVFALPSHSEGSPNVVLEAMAAGVPVVATAVGGVPEILDNGRTGLLVPPRDPVAMAAAIRRLLTEPETRRALAAAASAEVEAHYTPEAYCRSMTAFYQRTLAEWRG